MAAKLLDAERDVVLRRYLAVTAGRVPVVVGVSARASWMGLDDARGAEDAGAAAGAPDGVRNLELVFEHFRRVSESLSIPEVVQDEPVNTGVTMPAPFLVRLLDELEGVVADRVGPAAVGLDLRPLHAGHVQQAG